MSVLGDWTPIVLLHNVLRGLGEPLTISWKGYVPSRIERGFGILVSDASLVFKIHNPYH